MYFLIYKYIILMYNYIVKMTCAGSPARTGPTRTREGGYAVKLAECPKMCPVYTWHADEMLQAADRVVRTMERRYNGKTWDENCDRLLKMHFRLIKLYWKLNREKAPVAYIEKEDRDFVKKICTWLKEHPEN